MRDTMVCLATESRLQAVSIERIQKMAVLALLSQPPDSGTYFPKIMKIMMTVRVELPKSLSRWVEAAAIGDGVSPEQWISTALIRYARSFEGRHPIRLF